MNCSRCKNNKWTCLGCKKMIFNESFNSQNPNIAVYCDCCKHNYVCKECYDKKPGYDNWKPIFGNNHSIKDLISGETSASRFMKALLDGKTGSQTFINGNGGSVNFFSTTNF